LGLIGFLVLSVWMAQVRMLSFIEAALLPLLADEFPPGGRPAGYRVEIDLAMLRLISQHLFEIERAGEIAALPSPLSFSPQYPHMHP
jgi:hypothetical protein